MALIVKDRVKETFTTTGTADFTLGGSSSGFQTFAVIGDGNTTYYAAVDQATGAWEVGVGTYSSTGPTLTRDTVLESSNSGSKVNFAAGSKEVFCTYPAERSVYLDAAGSAVSVLDIGTLGVSTANISTANITAGTITTTPASGNDLVNKTYVDTIVASGIHFHEPVRVESPINLNATYNNGTAGVGATLTNAGTQVALVIDGITMVVADRVLVYEQTNQTQNGVYVVTSIGSGSTNWVLTRADDADTFGIAGPDTLSEGSTFFVQEGATGAGETYTCNTTGTITFGTTNITFAQISSAQIYSAGTGLTLSGTQFSITNTGTAGTYGSASSVPVFVTNAQGQVTSVTPTAIAITSAAVSGLAPSATTDTTDASNISSGTLPSARLNGSYTGITGVGTLTAGTWNASTIAAIYGGTGLTSFVQGDLLYATSSTTIGRLADAVAGNALISGGVGGDPVWGKIGLDTHVTGTLPVANGGTGQTTANAAFNALAPSQTGNSGRYLTTDGSNTSWAVNPLGTVTSVSGTGTVSGITLTGTVTTSGSLTLGGTLNLSSPPTIGNTTPNTGTFTEVAVTTATGNSAFNENDTITGWNYSGNSFSIAGQETSPTGLFIGSAGTKMYVNGSSGDDVNEYTLGTAWDITTATFVTAFSTSAEDTSPQDVFFKPDGLSMYVVGSTNDTVFQYTLGTAWSVATASYASKSFSVAAQDTTPTGIWFKPDGTVMYVIGTSSDTVFQYALSTAWDVSTASYSGISYSVAAQETGSSQVNLSAAGTTMWIVGSSGDDIWEYTLGTAWNVSTATPVNNFYVGFQDVTPTGLFIDSTAPNRVYMVGSTTDAVYRYNTEVNSLKLDTEKLYVDGVMSVNGNFVAGSNAYVDGALTVQGAAAVGSLTSGTTTVTGTLTSSGTTTLATSTATQTASFASGATVSGSTKTINFGTAGVSGSTTNITFGSSTGTTNVTANGTWTYANTISGSISGNAATATTATSLQTARTIAITGDLTYTSGSFNGSANVTGTGTLANSGVTAGSYTYASITVDAKGRVTTASSGAAPSAFPAGTVMLFVQTSAPTGWTKSTTHDNKALRVVSGTAGSGGSAAFTTAFGTPSVSGSVSGTVGNTTLTTEQMPAHSHTGSAASTSLTGAFAIRQGGFTSPSGVFFGSNSGTAFDGGSSFTANRTMNIDATHTHTLTLGGTGGGGSHNHSFSGSLASATATINVAYVDVIIATKD